MHILVTGGAGYIGSHTCLELLAAGHEVAVVDNLSNSKAISLERVQALAGRSLEFFKADLLDREALEDIFRQNAYDAVIHFAGYKAVGESVTLPLKYYHNNISGTLILCDVMQRHGVYQLIFSSSATVYGNPDTVPIAEDFPLRATNPYGQTKLTIEIILSDLHTADSRWHPVLLRYFNPVGAHESGRIGEDPRGIPNNLMPYIAQVAVGKLERLQIFGNDYATPDGTGVRDFIHVADLAEGHVRALDRFSLPPAVDIYNLGTGRGYSVLQMLAAFERACGRKIPHSFVQRRPGDAAACYADPSKAKRELGWTARRDIDAMCRDAWHWQHSNPDGY